MGLTPDTRFREAAGEAQRCARVVARRCRVEIVEPLPPDQQRAAVALLGRVWQLSSPESLITAPLLRVLEHSGNYVAGAYRDGVLIGAATALFGRGHLHSDLLGVAREHQGSGVGFALKQHQRAWALECGVDEVRWTFDPLLRTNAHFNIRKLGARAVGYLPSFYEPSDESDRLYVRWRLCSPAAVAAARGEARRPGSPQGPAHVLLDRVDGRPALRAFPPGGVPLLVALPDDGATGVARRWRAALREALTTAFAAGYEIVDVLPGGYYLRPGTPATTIGLT